MQPAAQTRCYCHVQAFFQWHSRIIIVRKDQLVTAVLVTSCGIDSPALTSFYCLSSDIGTWFVILIAVVLVSEVIRTSQERARV